MVSCANGGTADPLGESERPAPPLPLLPLPPLPREPCKPARPYTGCCTLRYTIHDQAVSRPRKASSPAPIVTAQLESNPTTVNIRDVTTSHMSTETSCSPQFAKVESMRECSVRKVLKRRTPAQPSEPAVHPPPPPTTPGRNALASPSLLGAMNKAPRVMMGVVRTSLILTDIRATKSIPQNLNEKQILASCVSRTILCYKAGPCHKAYQRVCLTPFSRP